MQNPNEDTQWNDALRRHGILAENSKEGEVTEDQLINLLEETVQKKTGNVVKAYEDMTLDELEELEDEEDERVLLQYRSEKKFLRIVYSLHPFQQSVDANESILPYKVKIVTLSVPCLKCHFSLLASLRFFKCFFPHFLVLVIYLEFNTIL